MYKSNKVIVVMPAYNASKTLSMTLSEIPSLVDEVILCDDSSTDDTFAVAQSLGIAHVLRHEKNRGYGANQKTLYDKAIAQGGDIIVMLHPDYQYTPMLMTAMVSLIGEGVYPVVLGSRILGNGARKGGMPTYKYYANRVLTLIQNALCGTKLSEYHTGYRAYDRKVLDSINYSENSDDFIFDNEMLSQIIMHGWTIGEVTCPTKYFDEASSINFRRSVIYGLGVLRVSLSHFIHRTGLWKMSLYS
jgi:glycosyltransferase involved in cell wall biosynthesis